MPFHFSFDDVEALRHESQPLAMSIAPVVTANLFKSPRCYEKPKSKDFSSLLSVESSNRAAASLKASGARLGVDIISLGTGRPSPEYFPFLGLNMKFPQGPHFSETDSCKAISSSVGKYDMSSGIADFDLAVSLNYGYSAGSEQLVRFLTEHMDVIHNPPYSDWQTALTIGSTSAVDMALRMFCSRGDYIIMEEYTFSGLTEAARPLGLQAAVIKMDDQGFQPDHLREVLSVWDEAERGSKKPRVLYSVPTGHNPTGTTQSLQRRKEIYAIAEQHDLYIIEDDPYYFLQFDQPVEDQYPSASERQSHGEFLHGLIPSYLSLDVSGRVLRLDSMSKLLAPGLRCGWMTGASHLIERFLHYHDVSVVCPSGLTQLAVYNLLDRAWGHHGFMDWLLYLRDEYVQRRDVLIRACENHLPNPICSWKTPNAGMFLWIKITWTAHPSVIVGDNDGLLSIENKVYETALAHGVICCKGSAFRADANPGEDMFFRLSFATASLPHITEAVVRFGKAIGEEFDLKFT